LTKTFISPTYGYSIRLADSFSATPATSTWTPETYDGQDIIGTTAKLDPFVMVGSTAIPAGTTFDDWLAAHYPRFPGPDGGCTDVDPATWPPIQVGNQVGRRFGCGNWIKAIVEVGGRAYEFSWMTQVADVHHTLADWKEMLKSVTFDPASASGSIPDGARS
jgi:hypothetical protein